MLCDTILDASSIRGTVPRFDTFVSDRAFQTAVIDLARGAAGDPQGALQRMIGTGSSAWIKNPLWIEMGVAGTRCRVVIKRKQAGHNMQ